MTVIDATGMVWFHSDRRVSRLWRPRCGGDKVVILGKRMIAESVIWNGWVTAAPFWSAIRSRVLSAVSWSPVRGPGTAAVPPLPAG